MNYPFLGTDEQYGPLLGTMPMNTGPVEPVDYTQDARKQAGWAALRDLGLALMANSGKVGRTPAEVSPMAQLGQAGLVGSQSYEQNLAQALKNAQYKQLVQAKAMQTKNPMMKVGDDGNYHAYQPSTGEWFNTGLKAPVQTIEDTTYDTSGIGTRVLREKRTGNVVKSLGGSKPIAINLNKPSQEEVRNAAWKVANGEIDLSSIPARSTARMAVINELSTNPAYQDLNLAEVSANRKKSQDLALIRSNSLIQAIDEPLKNYRQAFTELRNSNVIPANVTKNWIDQNLGDSRITKVNAYKNELVREIQRALTNTGTMAQQGVQQQLDLLNSSYSLPQIDASINALNDILKARLKTQTDAAYPNAKPKYNPLRPKPKQPGSGRFQIILLE